MAQKLILALNKTKVTASYKNAAYKVKYTYTHYGGFLTSRVNT